MSARTRGIEQKIMLGIEGQLQDKGTWLKVKDFRVTVRGEIVEDDYAGEKATDLDYRFDGYDVAISFDEEDAATIDYVQQFIDRELQGGRPLRAVISHLKTFREPGNPPITLVYRQGIIMETEEGFDDRKSRYTYQFAGKFKFRKKING